MKIYLKHIVNQLRNYSETLDKTSILLDKPWALIDDDFEMQKLIFTKDKSLILSKNGQVQIGKWDYFPEAKSLLIDRISDKILCNEAFIDKGILILRIDGTVNKFFMLANENIVPDLDVNRYLKDLRYQKLKISERKLIDGRVLEVQKVESYSSIDIGNYVTVDAEPIEDGKYQLETYENYYEVKNGRIISILTETKYINPDNQEIIIQQQDSYKIKYGDYVFMFGRQLDSTTINFSRAKNLIVRDGKVIRLERKNKFSRWISKSWNTMTDNYYE